MSTQNSARTTATSDKAQTARSAVPRSSRRSFQLSFRDFHAEQPTGQTFTASFARSSCRLFCALQMATVQIDAGKVQAHLENLRCDTRVHAFPRLKEPAIHKAHTEQHSVIKWRTSQCSAWNLLCPSQRASRSLNSNSEVLAGFPDCETDQRNSSIGSGTSACSSPRSRGGGPSRQPWLNLIQRTSCEDESRMNDAAKNSRARGVDRRSDMLSKRNCRHALLEKSKKSQREKQTRKRTASG